MPPLSEQRTASPHTESQRLERISLIAHVRILETITLSTSNFPHIIAIAIEQTHSNADFSPGNETASK